MIARVYLIL